jgi:Flp pilus assembly protein TadD
MKRAILLMALILPMTGPAYANTGQDADESALDALDKATPPVVVKQEPAGAADLRDAIRRIAQRPSDHFALTDAGYAAIKLGDYDAAFNFFSKANTFQPADARIKAGLAIAQVRRENPFEALSLFDEAIRLGGNERSFALDRALAYDLLGNFERAEKDYTLAGSWANSDELALRHAISVSLAGRRDDADRMLIPMLQKENPEAWRARALMLAARGDYKEAGKIAAGFLDEREARRMEGYFRNMPKLTMAQQAAAMHFGHFPVGSNIGSDSEQLVTLAASTGVKPVAQGDSRLIPAGEPFGTKRAAVKTVKPKKPAAKDKKLKAAGDDLATASAQQATNAAAGSKVATLAMGQLPVPETARPPVRILLPAFAAVVKTPEPEKPAIIEVKQDALVEKTALAELPAIGPAVGQIEPVKTALPVTVAQDNLAAALPPIEKTQTAVAVADVAKVPAQPGFESVEPSAVTKVEAPTVAVAEATTGPQIPVQSQSQPVVAAAGIDSFDLGAIVNSIEVPDEEKRPSVAPVDLSKIKVAAAKSEVVAAKVDLPAKGAKTAVNTPRYFVQIATGADMNGLGFDYRRMAKKHGALFANQDGWTSAWGKTKRLLVGPFADMKSAKKWESDLRKAGGDGFVWQSDKNTAVEKLKGK